MSPKAPEDRCECRGQCSKHAQRCVTLFGQAHLYDAEVDLPAFSKYGKDRRLCASCAASYDPHRKARERRMERAASEQQQVGQAFFKSYDERMRAGRAV